MALLLLKSRYLYVGIPKTGCHTVTAAILMSGIPSREIAWLDAPLDTAIEHAKRAGETGIRGAFTFVRNPYDWYRSYWAQRQLLHHGGWAGGNHPWITACGDKTFEGFVRKLCDREPAAYTRLIQQYTESDYEGLVEIGKTESLDRSLIDIMLRIGEPAITTPVQKLNAGASLFPEQTAHTDETIALINKSELEVFHKYGYQMK